MIKLNPIKKVFNTISKNMSDQFSEDKGKHADSVIRNHVVWSMGAGLIPIAIADVFAVSAVQLDMIRQMSKIYGLDFKETEGKALITTLTGSTLARIGASAVKLIPGIGSVLGGVSMSLMAGASTYALGEVFKTHFATGGTFLDFDPGRMRNFYKEKFEKGKKVAKEWKKESEQEENEQEKEASFSAPVQEEIVVVEEVSTIDPIAKLKELAQLKADGIITEEEFETMKKRVIGA